MTEPIKGGIALDEKDVQYVVARLPRRVREALEALEAAPLRRVVAGGFLRAVIAGEEPKDVDLFCPGREDADALAAALFGAGRYLSSDFAHTGIVAGQVAQVIHRWSFAGPDSVLAHFDFTACRACVYHDGGRFHGRCDPAFDRDLARRRLVYTRPDPEHAMPGGSLLRAFKLAGRGWRIPLDSLAELLEALYDRQGGEAILDLLVQADPNGPEERTSLADLLAGDAGLALPELPPYDAGGDVPLPPESEPDEEF